MNHFKSSKLFFWTIELLLFILIFYLLYQVSFIFNPLKVIFFTIFSPVMIALFLYYLCNPIVSRLGKLNIPKPLSIIVIMLSVIVFVVILVVGFIPEIVYQTGQLINSLPSIFESAYQQLDTLFNHEIIESLQVENYFDTNMMSFILPTVLNVFSGIGNFAGSLWSSVINLITVPIVLIYVFKDGHKFYDTLINIVPKKHSGFVKGICSSIHSTLQAYITGQAVVCLYVGSSLFICYLVIGVPYAFLLGIFAGLMDIIPYVGPWIASIPAILVAFSISPLTALIVIVAIIIIQIGESYIVSPYVMAKSLHLHPLLVIFILLIAGQLAGLVGMILGIPIFMIIKILLTETFIYIKKEKSVSVLIKDE